MSASAENIIGAFALAVADGISRDVSAPLGLSVTAAAAIALIGYAPGCSIEGIRGFLRLSHSGAVRLVDRLVEADLAERVPAPADGRVVALKLTSGGAEAWATILSARQGGLTAILNVLSDDEIATLSALAGKVLGAVVRTSDDARHLCRLCNYRICSNCPVEAGLTPAM